MFKPSQLGRSSWLVLVYCGFMVATGVVGLVGEPSRVLIEVLGALSLFYSISLIAVSVGAGAAVMLGTRRMECTTFITMGLLTGLHAVIIFVMTGPAWDQTAWRLVSAALLSFIVAELRWQRGISQSAIARHVSNFEKFNSERDQ